MYIILVPLKEMHNLRDMILIADRPRFVARYFPPITSTECFYHVWGFFFIYINVEYQANKIDG